MARAWLEPPSPGWGDVASARSALEHLAYLTAELRGPGGVLLRVSGVRLDPGELLRVPGER